MVAAAAAFAVWLSACSAPSGVAYQTDTPSEYALTVRLRAGDTARGLADRYGGVVREFAPHSGYALLGLDSVAASRLTRARARGARPTTVSGEPEISDLLSLESNLDVFEADGSHSAVRSLGSLTAWADGSLTAWADGSLTAWADGSLTAWADGSLTAWADGIPAAVRPNIPIWLRLNLPVAHKMAYKLGRGVTVAVIDSGVDLQHPALVGSLAPTSAWRDYVGNDNIPQEEGSGSGAGYGHGTAVASVIRQVAPNAKILPLRVLDPNGSGDVLNVASAIRHAASTGAKIINVSLGSIRLSPAVLAAVNEVTAKGTYVFASAGNRGTAGSVSYPARDADIGPYRDFQVSVGSVSINGARSAFSSYGVPGRPLSLVAPGENVATAYPGARVVSFTGTSMSTPMAAGAAALALGQGTLKVSPAGLIQAMLAGADDVSGVANNPEGLGNRRLDIAKFLIRAISYQ